MLRIVRMEAMISGPCVFQKDFAWLFTYSQELIPQSMMKRGNMISKRTAGDGAVIIASSIDREVVVPERTVKQFASAS
jgi:hypothetical protein